MPDNYTTIPYESSANSEDLFLDDDLDDIFVAQAEHDEDFGDDDDDFSDAYDSNDSEFGQMSDELKHNDNIQDSVNKDNSSLPKQSESESKKKVELYNSDGNARKGNSVTTATNTIRQSLSTIMDVEDMNVPVSIGSVPPPSWHCEEADKDHRRAMILEIARLLQERKKATPSEEWLHQLPHKARKLEGRLYRTAASLEAYLERSTLKIRLSLLANAITKHYVEHPSGRESSAALSLAQRQSLSKLAKRNSMRSLAASRILGFDSKASLLTMASSVDTTRSLNRAMQQASVEGMKVPSLDVDQHNSQKQQISAVISTSDGNTNGGPNSNVVVIENTKSGNSIVDDNGEHRAENQSSTSSSNSVASGSKLPKMEQFNSRKEDIVASQQSLHQVQMQQKLFHQQGKPASSLSIGSPGLARQNSGSDPGLPKSTNNLPVKSPLLNFSEMSSSDRYDRPMSTSSLLPEGSSFRLQGSSQSELDRQKAVNAKLQQQIMQNIRLQEDLVRRIQATNSSQTTDGMLGGHSTMGSGMNIMRSSNLNSQMSNELQGSMQNTSNIDNIGSPSLNPYVRNSLGLNVTESSNSFPRNSMMSVANDATPHASSNNAFNMTQADFINRNNRTQMNMGRGTDIFAGDNGLSVQNSNPLGGGGMLGMVNLMPPLTSHSNTNNNIQNGSMQYLMATQQLQNRGIGGMNSFPSNEPASQQQLSQQQIMQQQQLQLLRQSLLGQTPSSDNSNVVTSMHTFHQPQPVGADSMTQLQNSNLMLNSSSDIGLIGVGAVGTYSNRNTVNNASHINNNNSNNETAPQSPDSFYW